MMVAVTAIELASVRYVGGFALILLARAECHQKAVLFVAPGTLSGNKTRVAITTVAAEQPLGIAAVISDQISRCQRMH